MADEGESHAAQVPRAGGFGAAMSGEEDENISLDDAELKEMQAKGRAYATVPSWTLVGHRLTPIYQNFRIRQEVA